MCLILNQACLEHQWITKGNKSGSIWKDTENKLEVAVSVHKIQSDQPGLVPQLSSKHTSARIWAYQVIVDDSSYLTYFHLVRSTSQEENLALRASFYRWATTFGV